MDLPDALAPWGAQLAIFPHDVALGLGPLVQRVALAVGGLPAHGGGGEGEPDGYTGVSRRGGLDRMLLTEWLMADEEPDEFLRRYSEGELAYLQLARQEPRRSRRSMVLFDAGPGQLGTPRIGHLAALIVLARRAEAAGVHFGWGLLQAPGTLLTSLAPPTVHHLLDGRTHVSATEAHVCAWIEQLGNPARDDDLWIVGAPRLRVEGASRIHIDDVIEPDVRRLCVRVERRGQRKQVVLDLPDERLSTRLLRAPFEELAAVHALVRGRLAPSSNLVFAAHGRTLYARGPGGGIVSYPVGSGSQNALPRLLRRGDEVAAAVGHFARGTLVVSATGETVLLHRYSRRGRHAGTQSTVTVGGKAFRFSSVEAPLKPLVAWPHPPPGVPAVWLLDGEGTLFMLHGGTLAHADSHVATVRLVGGRILYAVGRDASGPRLVSVRDNGLSSDTLPLPPDTVRVLLGAPADDGVPTFGLFAHESGDATWTICWSGPPITFHAPRGVRVFGVMATHGEPGLVVVDADQRGLTLVTRKKTKSILRSADDIVDATMSPTERCLAYATRSGQLVFHSLERGGDLYRMVPEADP